MARSKNGQTIRPERRTPEEVALLRSLLQEAESAKDLATWRRAKSVRYLDGQKVEQAERIRMVAYPHLVQINGGLAGDFSLVLSNNAHTGGTCFGDSGGPNFIGASNVIGGVTSRGWNDACGGTGGVYRVDRADDLNWLYSEFADHLP